MINRILIETGKDSLFMVDNIIHAVVNSEEYTFELSGVKKIVMFTTELGPFYDDMGLTIDVGNNAVIIIMSEHRCFKTFLFDQIGKALPIDYKKIIDASSCVENHEFEIYVKES